jgi:hypothetical protein
MNREPLIALALVADTVCRRARPTKSPLDAEALIVALERLAHLIVG